MFICGSSLSTAFKSFCCNWLVEYKTWSVKLLLPLSLVELLMSAHQIFARPRAGEYGTLSFQPWTSNVDTPTNGDWSPPPTIHATYHPLNSPCQKYARLVFENWAAKSKTQRRVFFSGEESTCNLPGAMLNQHCMLLLLDIPPLSTHRKYLKLTVMYNIVNNHYHFPTVLCDIYNNIITPYYWAQEEWLSPS